MVTSTHSEINIDTMHQYVVGPVALQMMMCMFLDKLDEGAISMYPDATKARFCFQQDVTIERMDTITDNQPWHQFTIVDHRKYFKELVSPQLFEC